MSGTRITSGNKHQTADYIIAASDSNYPEHADDVCSGSSDQTIINDAVSGGSTHLLQGKFHISAPIQMKESFSYLGGAGHGWDIGGTMIYLEDGSDCNMIELLGTEHRVYFPTVHDLILEGNMDNNASGHGIYCPVTTVNDVSDQQFYNLGIHHIKENGMQILGGWYVSLMNVWCEVCGNLGAKINVQANILNSVFSSNGGTGIEVGQFVHISNSSMEQNVTHGIQFNSTYSSIINSMIRGNSKDSAGNSHGIVNWSHNDILIANNVVSGSNKQGYGIYTGGASERNVIHDNIVYDSTIKNILTNGSNHIVHHNSGHITENSGTATMLSANTSIIVTHGLGVTPTAGDIMIVPLETWGNMANFWVDTYTSTQFTIHADVAPGANTDFAWKALIL